MNTYILPIFVGCLSLFSVLASAEPSVLIKRIEYGDKWPLKVSEATLECKDAGKIVIKANGKTYWFNGLANGAAKKNGWANLEDIWADDPNFGIPGAKKNIEPIFVRARSLCPFSPSFGR